MRVLLGVDGSSPSDVAVELVAAIDRPAGTSIRIVSVVPIGAGLFGGLWPVLVDADGIEAGLHQVASDAVERARARVARPGVEVIPDVLRGRPAARMLEAATSMSADLVIVGSRGHSTIETMLLGSVSAEVVDHATVPVLVVRRATIGRLVLAWDGSGCARAASELLTTWPIFRTSAVRVVSVADVSPPWWTGFPLPGSPEVTPEFAKGVEASGREHEALAEDMAQGLRAAGLEAEPEVRTGDAASEIIGCARDTGSDVIVLGTHGHTALERLILGSVARHVLQHAECSVLITRQGAPADA